MNRFDRTRGLEKGSGNRLVSLAAAIVAVLAALGTLFSHHRSIAALAAKNEAILKSCEILQFATTLFEIAIVFVSISALAGARLLLPFGCGVSVVGLVFLVIGLLQAR